MQVLGIYNKKELCTALSFYWISICETKLQKWIKYFSLKLPSAVLVHITVQKTWYLYRLQALMVSTAPYIVSGLWSLSFDPTVGSKVLCCPFLNKPHPLPTMVKLSVSKTRQQQTTDKNIYAGETLASV